MRPLRIRGSRRGPMRPSPSSRPSGAPISSCTGSRRLRFWSPGGWPGCSAMPPWPSPAGRTTACRSCRTCCGCLAVALMFTFAYIVPKVRGIRGRSSREGTYYSLAWFLGMPLSALILSRVNAFLADLNTSQANEVASVVSNALPCLVVGVIFLMSAALWNEVVMGVLGGWILLVTLVVTIAGMPWAWWIMSVAGGGGMLVAAVVSAAAVTKRGA